MNNVNPGTIVYVDNEVYIVKKKVGVYQCYHCALLKACQEFVAEHLFSRCFDFLISNPNNSEKGGLILRKPFQLTKESVGRVWPIHSVIEWNEKVGIVVERDEMREALLPFGCKDCILRRCSCADFPCMPDERKDHKNIVVLSLEWAHKLKSVKIIYTDNNND